MDRKVFFSLVAFAALVGYLYLVFTIVAPLLRALAWGVVIGLATFPLYRRLRTALKERSLLASLLMTSAVLCVLVVPVVMMIIYLTGEVVGVYHLLEQEVAEGGPIGLVRVEQHPAIRALGEHLQPLLKQFDLSFREALRLATSKVMSFLLGYSTAMVKNSFAFTLKLILMVVTLFFIYKDGERMQESLWSVIPLHPDQKAMVVRTIKNVLSAILYGVFLTCLIQGTAAGIGYWLFDVPSPLLFGALSVVAALIPLVGTALIWLPAAGYLALQGAMNQALFLMIWCVVLVVPADNIVRPLFISGRGHISLLVVAVGLIGGLAAFGFVGIIIGPLVLSLFQAFLAIYRGQMELAKTAGRD